MALSIPYDLFSGALEFRPNSNNPSSLVEESRRELQAFAKYVQDLQSRGTARFDFDLASFESDLAHGLYFDSTIPTGYGLGSSGALCAALNDRYGVSVDKWQQEEDVNKLFMLKEIFSQMESHFHGSSSGVDPLISYTAEAILIERKGELGPVKFPQYNSGDGAIFLLNTGRPRRTEPLVNLFLEKLKRRDFQEFCHNELIPTNNICIESFLSGDKKQLFKKFGHLSEFQFEHFNPMIPKLLTNLWEKGIESDDFYLKLCGAGGGGVFLGITRDFKKALESFDGRESQVLFRL